MKLYDLEISTQLRLGLGIILLLVLIIGGLAWVQTDKLWNQTKGLYEHPHQVRRALGALEADIHAIRGAMKDLVLEDGEHGIEQSLREIKINEADGLKQFTILFDRYLGPPEDIRNLHNEFMSWQTVREETIGLLRSGHRQEAVRRIRNDGIGGRHVQTVISHINTVNEFAKNKGDQFYRDALHQNHSLKMQLGLVVAVIIAATFLISWLLIKRIKEPLQDLTGTTRRFQGGDLASRSRYSSVNEFGLLAAAFNAMADTVQTELQIKKAAASLSEIMLQERDLHGFCRELLSALREQTNAQIAAIYLLDEDHNDLVHFDSIGLSERGRDSFSATGLEGEFGPALASGRIQHLTDIPEDTRFTLRTVSGELLPREILTVPIQVGNRITAVVSLASIHPFTEASLRLVDNIWSVMSARLTGVQAFRKIREQAEILEAQNRELEEQRRALSIQASELSEQNTELELQKKQLNEANRLKSVFLSNMSHELRTPLNSVIVLSDLLHRRLAGTIAEEEHGYLEVIERNGKALLALINDILDLSRIESGREELSIERFSLRSLVAEIIDMLAPQASEKQVALVNQVSEALPPLVSDHGKCRHILQNLLSNAFKFTDHGEITVSARQLNGDVEIVVTDTGIGIAAEHLPHIFDEFRQADDSTSRKYGGTGLGLAIARKYANLLGGTIRVKSELGKGSIFFVRLPLRLAPLAAATEAVRTPEPGGEREHDRPAARSPYILLVEDSEPAIIQITDILQGQGYRVDVARSGKEGLEMVREQSFDAMVLDLMMPEVDGFQVLHELRRESRTAELPVLILTAKHVTPEELEFLKGNHIHQLIQKGDIDRSGLIRAIAKMTSGPQSPKSMAGASVQPPAAPATDGLKPLVLVVEDNPDNLRTATALLQEHFRVIEAENGRVGVDFARDHHPDIILMDIAMPVMDGREALRRLRADERTRNIPVLAVTASAMIGDREDIMAVGFNGYIAKPIDAHKLHGEIATQLKARSAAGVAENINQTSNPSAIEERR